MFFSSGCLGVTALTREKDGKVTDFAKICQSVISDVEKSAAVDNSLLAR